MPALSQHARRPVLAAPGDLDPATMFYEHGPIIAKLVAVVGVGRCTWRLISLICFLSRRHAFAGLCRRSWIIAEPGAVRARRSHAAGLPASPWKKTGGTRRAPFLPASLRRSRRLCYFLIISPEPKGLEAAVDRRSLPSMPATDLSSHGAFARLARAFVEIGAAEHLPVLPKVGASDLDSAVALASAAVAEGVPPEVFEKLLAWRADRDLRAAGGAAGGPGPLVPAGKEAASRPDIPIRREVRRASKRAAIEAALDENRDAALADIDGNILARVAGSVPVPGPDVDGRLPRLGPGTLADHGGEVTHGRGILSARRLPLRPKLL